MLALVVAVVVVAAAGGHWLFATCLAWQFAVASGTPQVVAWHPLFLLPLLGLGTPVDRRFLLAAFALWFLESAVAYGHRPQPRHFFQKAWDLVPAAAAPVGGSTAGPGPQVAG